MSFRLWRAVVDANALPSSDRRWYASGCRGLRIQHLGPYFTAAARPAALRTPRPPRIVSPSGVLSEGPIIGPVYTVTIHRVTHAATSATPLVDVFSPDAPSSASAPAASSEIPISIEIEHVESVERYTHTGWVRDQRAEPVCDAPFGTISVEVPRFHRVTSSYIFRPQTARVVKRTFLAEKGCLYMGDGEVVNRVQKITPPL